MNKFKYGKDAFTILMLISITCFYIFSFLGYDMTRIFGDLGDGRLNNYFLEHGYQYVIGNHASFWSAPFFYPVQFVMTYSDNHIGTLPFYILYRMLGYDIETSYQIWQLSIFVLNSVSAYIVLRLLKFNCLPSLFAALTFSISAPVLLKTNHIQLMPRFMIPFIFYGLIKYTETIKLKYFYLFCVALVYQFYIGIYMGFFSVMTMFLMFPFAFFYINKNYGFSFIIERKYLIKLLTSMLLSFIALYTLFRPYIKFKQSSGGRSWFEVSNMLPRLESWFYTTYGPIDYFNQIGSNLPIRQEHMMYVGLLPFIAILFSVFVLVRSEIGRSKFFYFSEFKRYSMSIVASLLIVFSVFISTLYLDGFSLYKPLFFKLPGFDAIRAVTDYSLITFPSIYFSCFFYIIDLLQF